MSSAPEPAAAPRPRSRPRPGAAEVAASHLRAIRALDLAIVAALLGLTFLLGIFPLNDTDFWWHLRTGESMLDGAPPPQVDPYLYGRPAAAPAGAAGQPAPGMPWIDLHWGFEVLIAWGYRRGGVILLNLAKCVITTLAVGLLFTARRREWPVPVMALAWLPALFVLGGRMYVRPETLSLLYLAIDLAILFRWKERPRLAWLLPVVQVLWVNTQGLFIFGPVLIGMALVDAALDRGALGPERRGWWRTILPAVAAVGLACFVNPYGWRGALFPLELFFGTMNNPIFAESIAELQSLASFLVQNGWSSLPIRILLATMALGALSFVIPVVWRVLTRLARVVTPAEPEPEPARRKGAKALADASKPAKAKARGAKPAVATGDPTQGFRLSPFRVLLYLAFTWMAWKASRNSHQFAAVVGTVTAWNFGEWAAAVIRRRGARSSGPDTASGFGVRLAVLGVLGLALAWVGSGLFYVQSGEGRTVALGEKPLWYPHEAVKFAGGPGMPERFLCMHNGLAGLFVYHNSPRQQVYADARLEVVGPELYGAYRQLSGMISADQGDWRAELRRQGDPGIVADLIQSGSEQTVATLLADRGHVCVWFDAMAAVFVPRSAPAARSAIDFLTRHFEPDLATSPRGVEALNANARALRNVAAVLLQRSVPGGAGRSIPVSPTLAKPLILLGHGYAHQAVALDPSAADAWKLLGQLELLRDPVSPEVSAARVRRAFDPLFDLSQARATYALKRAVALRPDDFPTQVSLLGLYQARGLLEPTLPVLEQIARLTPINRIQEQTQTQCEQATAGVRQRLGDGPPASWRNLGELERTVAQLLERGRVASAADLLERAYEPRERGWDVADRLAALRMHLGEPDRARALWQSAVQVPRPALQLARVGFTHLVEEDYDAALARFGEALTAEPDLFEAQYGLAVAQIDAGHRSEAQAAARAAERTAPTEAARAAARQLLGLLGPESPPPVSR